MICPKCKKQIPEKSLKCGFCSTKIGTICKKCNSYNSIYNLKCVSCGNELLKLCPHCKGVNIPEATKCRKCGKPFEIKKTEEAIAEEKKKKKEIEKQKQEETKNDLLIYDAKLFSQQNAKELLKKAFISENKKIISLNGENGIGKTIVLKTAINEFDNGERIWLVGECSPITQLSPCGLIQNILLTFFNIPNFCLDNLQLKKDSQRFFQSEFPSLTNDEVFRLLNFLYPKDTSYYENIFENKNKTFIMLEKVFRTIIQTNKTVLIIENFDFIDGLSYELIHRLAISDYADTNLKLLITYSSKRPVQGYISSNYIKEDAYLNISLNVLEKEQINVFIDRFFDEEKKCPVSVKNKLAILSRGNAGVLEQYTSLLLDYKNKTGKFDLELPTTFSEALKMRLSYLKEDMNIYKTLQIAAIQGINFSPAIINEALQLQETHFFEILKTLQNLNFIVPVTQNVYAFKNTLLWKEIFEIIKLDENYYELNNNLISIFSEYTLSSNSIIAVMAQNIELYDEALEYWTQNTRLSAYIGDTNLYTISQKQTLTFLDKTTSDKKELIENNIYERLGKLLSEISPEEAMGYLPKAINYSKNYTTPFKEIELTGYMAQCCKKVGNYNGILECIDSVLGKLDVSQDLERAMVKSRKLEPLLKIGNCGELINLADTEILPIFDKYISSKKHKIIPIQALYKSWLETYLYLAEALVFQGNNRSFDVIATLFELFEKNNFTDKLFICKTKLALAFANTIKGDIEASEEILEDIIKTYQPIMDNATICRWNLINILNNILQKRYNGIKEELFQVVTFANNTNDHFTKNILKTLLGKILKDENKTKQALEIYSQQIIYFSKEKNALGALLCWYLIADAKLTIDGPNKSLDVSMKALDVAKNPKINNYIFTALYNKIIAEANIIKGDYESAKMDIEKAIMFTRKFEMFKFLGDLYLLYGKYLQDLAIAKTDLQENYAINAAKMYKKALLVAQSIKNISLGQITTDSLNSLKSFCKLNQISLTDI